MAEESKEKAEIRSLFHSLSNHLNKITMKTGQYLYTERLKDPKSMSPDSLEKQIKDLLADLNSIESSVIESGAELIALKNKIYKALGYEP